MTAHRLELLMLDDRLAVCSLDLEEGVPPWARTVCRRGGGNWNKILSRRVSLRPGGRIELVAARIALRLDVQADLHTQPEQDDQGFGRSSFVAMRWPRIAPTRPKRTIPNELLICS